MDAWKGDSSNRNSKLEIKVRHLGDSDSDAELPPISIKEKVPSLTKLTRKPSTPSQIVSNSTQSLSKQQKTKTPEPPASKPDSKLSRPASKASRNELDSKSLRLSANDLINEINNKQRESQLTNRSDSSKSSSRIIDSDDQEKVNDQESNTNLKENVDSDDSANDADNLSLRSKTSMSKRTESRQSKNVSVKSEEKTRRLSGAEVERIITNEVATQSARSTPSKSATKAPVKSNSSDSSDSSDTSSLETDSESSEESFMDVLNKSKSPNKELVKHKEEDHLNIDSAYFKIHSILLKLCFNKFLKWFKVLRKETETPNKQAKSPSLKNENARLNESRNSTSSKKQQLTQSNYSK